MKKIFVFMAAAVTLTGQLAPAADILSPGDPIIAFDFDFAVDSSYPLGEEPWLSLDNDPNTKYLNFGKEGTGLIFTPVSGSSTVQSMSFTTANDWPARDPDSWELYGTNGTIMSADNSTGDAESWSLIANGAADLPGGAGDCDPGDGRPCTPDDARLTAGPVYAISNSASYSSYKVVFPTIKDAGIANSMQVADINLYESTDGMGTPIGSFADLAIAIGSIKGESSYPGAESPAKAIDGVIWDADANSSSKYLNLGGTNSGFIVTPGPSIIDSFQMWVANDEDGRDPADWELYGTNEAIASVDNGQGDGENWTLIDSGTLALPTDRNDGVGDDFSSGLISVTNSTEYSSYRFVVKSLRDPNTTILQFAEVQFFGDVGVNGDFNNDGEWDCLDVNALTAAIAAGSTDLAFDMNGDGSITLADLTGEGTGWLAVGGAANPAATGGNPFLLGDANLDGSVDVSDFNEWNGNKFTMLAEWCSGDFTADGSVDVSDFNEWNGNKFQSSSGSVSAVPEPGAWCLALITVSVCLWRRPRVNS